MSVTKIEKLLRQILTMKQEELELCRHDLTTEYYRGDLWVKKVVGIFEEHIREIERYMKEDGELNIGKCKFKVGVCGLAYKRFDICAFNAERCDYYL